MSKRLVLNIVLAMAVAINSALEGLDNIMAVSIVAGMNVVIQACMIMRRQKEEELHRYFQEKVNHEQGERINYEKSK